MIGGCFRTVVAFHYGNLTHPSVDPPRIGFLSIVPNNASQLLTDAVKSAQQNGNFEGAFILFNHTSAVHSRFFPATTQVAPTGSAATASAITLSISSVAMPSGTDAPARSGDTNHTNVKNNTAASFRSNGLEALGTALVIPTLALLSCWI